MRSVSRCLLTFLRWPRRTPSLVLVPYRPEYEGSLAGGERGAQNHLPLRRYAIQKPQALVADF